MKIFLYTTVTLVMLQGFVSCNIHQEYATPETDTETLYRDVNTTDSTSFADLKWNEVFTDPLLQNIITEALKSNIDLRVAVANIENAESYLMQQKGALQPDLNLNASATQSKLANTVSAATGFATSQYSVFLSSSWEIDIWGKYRSAKKSAIADLLASESFRRAVQTKLISNLATSYYSLLALDEKLLVAEETVKSRESYLITIQELQSAGYVTSADIKQSEANKNAAEILSIQLKQQIRELENYMSLLMGKNPGPIERGKIQNQKIAGDFSTGVPALLLANRPDVMQKEFELLSALEMSNAARAQFYPSITITGRAGFVSNEGASLFDPTSFFANIAGGLLQPLLNKNLNRSRLRSKIALQQAALANYELSLLTAGKEVSDALYAMETAEEIAALRANQNASLEETVEINKQLLQYGEVNYVQVLTSEQSLLSTQIETINAKLNVLTAQIELYRSLGGGWKE